MSILSILCCAPIAIYTLIQTSGIRKTHTDDGKINASYFISIAALVLWVVGIIGYGASM